MIEYTKHSFGLNVFWTVFTGSAYPKAVPAALLSGIFHLFLEWILSDYDKEQMKIGHPYALGVVFTAVGFLIVFRANHAYGRLAAAADHLYHMETRSFDGIMQFKAFHMQVTPMSACARGRRCPVLTWREIRLRSTRRGKRKARHGLPSSTTSTASPSRSLAWLFGATKT
eukprot:3496604-Rhodomonas_salina.2